MIKTENGKIKIKGSKTEVMADYALITKNLVESFVEAGAEKDQAIEDVKEAHRIGLLAKEDIANEMRTAIGELLESLIKEIRDGGEKDE